ncbi:hypothetical protein JCM10212_006119 [Sporobolomyces blumeae]
MPHKKAKRSIRLANSQAKGFDNPPTAADSLLPIASTSRDGQHALDLDAVTTAQAQANKKDNKRRKPSGPSRANQDDLKGMSKSAWRVLNAEKLREEFHAERKRKREEEDQARNPNQRKKKPALTPLPYESLSTFNRRVEQELRPSINSVIAASKQTAHKKKENKKEKEELAKKKKRELGQDGEDDPGEDFEEDDEERPKYGKKKDGAAKAKPTPEESIDPFAPKRLQVAALAQSSKTGKKAAKGGERDGHDGDDGDTSGRGALSRGRTGKTEFDTASQVRRVDDVVLAPPSLAKPARKGLLAKVLGPGGAASSGTSDSIGPASGLSTAGAGGGAMRIAGAEEPVGRSRLPVDPIMKAMLDREREKAVRTYRELKAKQELEKQQNK